MIRDRKRQLPDNEEKRFQSNPYSICREKKGPLHGFLVNGRQVPVPKKNGDTAEIERFINSSLAEELAEREPVVTQLATGQKPGDFIPHAENGFVGLIVTEPGKAKYVTKDELELKRTAMYFSQQSAFSFGASALTIPGKGKNLICDISRNEISTVNIVRSPDRTGYDIVVRQKYDGIVGMTDSSMYSVGKYYDPMNPGALIATCVYHVGLEGGKPSISFKEEPEIRCDSLRPVTREEFSSRAKKFAEAHKDEVIGGLDNESLVRWNRYDDKEKAEIFERAVDKAISGFKDEAVPFSLGKITGLLKDDLASVVHPSKDAVDFELELAQAQADGVFSNEDIYASYLGQIGEDSFNNQSQRLPGDEEGYFQNNREAHCERQGQSVHAFMLNGKQIQAPTSKTDLSSVHKAVGAFLLSALPKNRNVIGQAVLTRGGGVSLPKPVGGFIDLSKDSELRKKVAKLVGDRTVAGDLAGLVVTEDGGFRAVTAKELALNRVAVSFCQRSSQRTLQRIIQHDAKRFEGLAKFGSDPTTYYTTNIVPAKDGYDVIVNQDNVYALGEDGTQRVFSSCVYHIGMADGRPKVTFVKRPQVGCETRE